MNNIELNGLIILLGFLMALMIGYLANKLLEVFMSIKVSKNHLKCPYCKSNHIQTTVCYNIREFKCLNCCWIWFKSIKMDRNELILQCVNCGSEILDKSKSFSNGVLNERICEVCWNED